MIACVFCGAFILRDFIVEFIVQLRGRALAEFSSNGAILLVGGLVVRAIDHYVVVSASSATDRLRRR